MPSLADSAPRRPAPAVDAPRPAGDHARAARLEARLAVYAQYAAVVAEQAAAAAAGDQARVAALDEARARAAEHFGELTAPADPAGADPAGADDGRAFRAALDDALAELAHQDAVDSALGGRLAALRAAILRGAGWADPPAPTAGEAPVGSAALVAARAAVVRPRPPRAAVDPPPDAAHRARVDIRF